MKPYNGHRSWNAWNIALWMGNVEGIYNLAKSCICKARCRFPFRRDSLIAGTAATYFMRMFHGEMRTPDGAVYNHLCVKLAMEGFME